MKLRLILIVLSLLAFLSASAGGYLYYSSLKESAFKEAERQSVTRMKTIKKNISSFLSENVKPASTLAGITELGLFLTRLDADSRKKANAILDHFKDTLGADVCYLMDPEGNTVASSNRNDPDSFVGKNFNFRPYFRHAIKGMPDLEAKTIEALISDLNTVPEKIRMAVRNHGGGHYNHSLFWTVMAPKAGGKPTGSQF